MRFKDLLSQTEGVLVVNCIGAKNPIKRVKRMMSVAELSDSIFTEDMLNMRIENFTLVGEDGSRMCVEIPADFRFKEV